MNTDFSQMNLDTPEIEEIIREYLGGNNRTHDTEGYKSIIKLRGEGANIFESKTGDYGRRLIVELDKQPNIPVVTWEEVFQALDYPAFRDIIQGFIDSQSSYYGLSIGEAIDKIRDYGDRSIFFGSAQYHKIKEELIKERRMESQPDITVLLEGSESKEGLKQSELFNEDVETNLKGINDSSSSGKLISESFFTYNIENISTYVRSRNMVTEWTKLKFQEAERDVNWNKYIFQYLIYKDTGYVPLHTLTFLPDPDYPWILFNSQDPEVFNKYASYSRIFSYSPQYISFVKKCIEKKYYNLVLFSRAEEDGHTSARQIKENLLKRFDSYLSRSPLLELPIPVYIDKKTTPDLYHSTRNILTWKRTSCLSSILGSTEMLCNFYYLARLTTTPQGIETTPLYSAMIKVEDISFVRACMVTNTPIPTDKIELWIAEEFDDISNRTIARKEFVANIRKPMEDAGIKIVVHPSLFDSLYESPEIPKFKTIKDQQEWIKGLTNEFLEKQRTSLGIKKSEVVIPSLISSFEEELSETLTSAFAQASSNKPIETSKINQSLQDFPVTIPQEEINSLMDQLAILDNQDLALAQEQVPQEEARVDEEDEEMHWDDEDDTDDGDIPF